MQVLMATLFTASLGAACAEGTARREQLFSSWQDAQRRGKSLVVRFTLETRDLVFGKREKSEGTFRLLRTPKGDLFASYELTESASKAQQQYRWTGLLCNDAAYLLEHGSKTAIRFEPADHDPRWFLETYFNPFVRLLDRQRAEAEWRLEVVKRDEWYTYLSVKPKQVTRSGWLANTLKEGRVVLMNKGSEGVPADMPRQFWYSDGVSEFTFDIQEWRLNPAEPPNPAEFTRPEDRPGWQVTEWPLGGTK